MFVLKLVFGLLQLLFYNCVSNVGQRGESLTVSPSTVLLGCHLCCSVSLLILPNAHVSWDPVDFYCYYPFYQPHSSCRNALS